MKNLSALLLILVLLLAGNNVYAQPANDNCAGAITVTQNMDTVWNSSTTVGATQSMPPCGVGTPDDDVWYKFTAMDSNLFIAFRNTPNPNFDKTISYEVFSGNCGSLTSVKCDDQSLWYQPLEKISGLTINQTYYIRFYSTSATGHYTFDFSLFGTPLYRSCATAPSLSINTNGFIDTFLWASTAFQSHSPIPYTVNVPCLSTGQADQVIFKFVANDTQQVFTVTSEGVPCPGGCVPYTFHYQFHTGNCSGLTNLNACVGSTCSCDGSFNAVGTYSFTSPKITIGNTYYLRMWTTTTASGRVDFTIGASKAPLPPANDSCHNAIAITTAANEAACTGVLVNTGGATGGVSACGSPNNNDDVWYKFIATDSNMVVKYSNLLSPFSTITSVGMGLYSGTCSSLSLVSGSCTSSFGSGGSGKKVISGLNIGQTYYLQLFTNTSANYGRFNLCVYDTMMSPPLCTTLLLPVNNDVGVSTSAALSWNAVTGAASYDVYMGASIGSASLKGNTTTNAYTASGLSLGTLYYWYVVPKNVHGGATGCSAGAWSFTTVPPPACATLLLPADNATGVSANAALSWNTVSGATSYDVYIGTSAGSATLQGNTTTNSYTASGLSLGTLYYWYVVTKDVNGAAVGCSTGAWSFTTVPPAPPNDSASGAYGIIVDNIPGGYPFNNKYSTQSPSEPFASCIKNGGDHTVWYKFAAPASGFVRVHLSANTSVSGSDALRDVSCALYSVVDSSDYNTFTSLTCNYNVNSDFDAYLFANELTPGNTYYLQVDGMASTSVGDFNIAVEDVVPAMLSAGSSCVQDTTLRLVRNDYRGWLSLLDESRLHAMVRNTSSATDSTGYVVAQYVNSLAVRQFNNNYYLDRNYFIHTTSPVGNVDIRLFFDNNDLAKLHAADAAATLPTVNVTKQTGTDCKENYDASGTRQLIIPNSNGHANGINWISFPTNGFSNFYIHAGNEGLSVPVTDKNNVQVYPNPVRDVLFINSLKAGDDNKVDVYDVTGKLMISEKISKGVQGLDVRALKPGFYYIKFVNDSSSDIIKIVKE